MTDCKRLSDVRLLELGLFHEYSGRFSDKEFVVYDSNRQSYVESIDAVTGDTEYTTDPKSARIFRGMTWASIWVAKHRRFILPENLP